MNKLKTSMAMLATLIGFDVVFGVIVPDVIYGSPEEATQPVEYSSAALGEVPRKVAPFVAGILGLYAVARFVKEMRD